MTQLLDSSEAQWHGKNPATRKRLDSLVMHQNESSIERYAPCEVPSPSENLCRPVLNNPLSRHEIKLEFQSGLMTGGC